LPRTDEVLDALATVEPTRPAAERLGLAMAPLQLRRAWPRAPDHLLLEYSGAGGEIVAGQWLGDPGVQARVERATVGAGPRVAVTRTAAGVEVLLQAGGADRHLAGLAPLLAAPGATLLGHRAERRAVVRLAVNDGERYAKVLRPERAAAAAAALRDVSELGAGFASPKVLGIDAGAGVVVSAPLAGSSLHELLGSTAGRPAARAAGLALAALHAAEPPPGAAGRNAAAEEATALKTWLLRLEPYAPELSRATAGVADDVLRALAGSPAAETVLLHRDLHDKQIFVEADGRVGLLDFDTLATGPAALDVANLLVHLELRALQGRCAPGEARAIAAELLAGYGSSREVPGGLGGWADATRLRLACVYAFRPRWRSVAPALLGLIGGAPEGS